MSIGFMMDAAMLALLAMTVFFAFRLSLSLRHFKESRFEMEGLVNRLTANIERAEKAIAGLQVSARNSGADLDKKIKESKFLADELKFMSEAGSSLASRLEKLADRNKELVEKIQSQGGLGPESSTIESSIIVKEQQPAKTHAKALPVKEEISLGFMIQDREFANANANANDDDLDDLDFELENSVSGLQSQAEREFFEALKKRKPSHGGN